MSAPTVTADGVVWLEKDAGARLNYAFELSSVLPINDTLTSLVASVTPATGMQATDVVMDGQAARAVFSGGTPGTWYAVKFRWTAVSGLADEFVVRVFIPADAEVVPSLGSALFPNRFTATATMRRDRLLLAARTVLAGAVEFSDDYVWEKLRAAESMIHHQLRVPFTPTHFQPRDPTPDQLAAWAGAPWEIDPGYDFEPDFFMGASWGFLQLRKRPLVSVESIVVRMPGSTSTFTVPPDWVRFDRKHAQVQLVPAGAANGTLPLNAFLMQMGAGGRTVPFAIEVSYTAGLSNVATSFPELLEVVRKQAALLMVEDTFAPQSGSISADGLSQSLSVDMDKYRDTIDHALFGAKGRNGGLWAAIHGVRMGTLG